MAHWHEHGYVIVDNYLSRDELAAIAESVDTHMPTWQEFEKRPLVYADLMGTSDRIKRNSTAAGVRYDFPYDDDRLNHLTFHPYLVAFAERIAGYDDLALSLGHLVGKYAGRGNFEQELHSDMSNNTLVVPCRSKKFFDIPMITYLTDVTIDLGPTYVVSQKHTDHRGLVEDGIRHKPRAKYPELYEAEKPALVKAGSTIIYSMRTYHRGSAMTAEKGHRFVLFSGFHTANIPWMAPMDQQHRMGTKEMDRFLVNADPRQRQMIGFPPVGHEYWSDPDVVTGVANRYPKMDMRPYGGGPPLV